MVGAVDTRIWPLQRPPLPITHALGSHRYFLSSGLAVDVLPTLACSCPPVLGASPGRSLWPWLPASVTVPLRLAPHRSLSSRRRARLGGGKFKWGV